MTFKPKLQRPDGPTTPCAAPRRFNLSAERAPIVKAIGPSPASATPGSESGTERRPIKLILLRTFLERAQISRSYYYALKKKNAAPLPVKLATGRQGAVRLVEAECEAWLADLVGARPVQMPDAPPSKKT